MLIAIIGAGLAGLTCARELSAQGHSVVIYEKRERCGGRLSTRETELGGFDHGAQYFTATTPDFTRTVAGWRRQGWVVTWEGKLAALKGGRAQAAGRSRQRYVAVPGMRALAENLLGSLELRSGHTVQALEAHGRQWLLKVAADTVPVAATAGPFDAVIVAMPADQAATLLAPVPTFATAAASVRMTPCWALMLAFQQPLDLGYDAAWVDGPRLGWICRDSSKPGRRPGEHWVAHATPAWSAEHVADDHDRAKEKMLKAFHEATGSAVQPMFTRIHRWLYALAAHPLEDDCLWDAKRGIGVCGDWFSAGLDGGGRVENAVLSAQALVRRIAG